MRRGCRPRTPAIAQAPLGWRRSKEAAAPRLSQAGAGGEPPPPPVLLPPPLPLPSSPPPPIPPPQEERAASCGSPRQSVFGAVPHLVARCCCSLGGEEWGRGKEVGDRGGGGKRRRWGLPPPPAIGLAVRRSRFRSSKPSGA